MMTGENDEMHKQLAWNVIGEMKIGWQHDELSSMFGMSVGIRL